MREEFEKLPDINKAIKIAKTIGCKVDFEAGSYVGDEDRLVDYLNSAYYACQEQQKKIAIKNELKDFYRKEVDFLRNKTSRAILALYSENKEDAFNILKEAIKE